MSSQGEKLARWAGHRLLWIGHRMDSGENWAPLKCFGRQTGCRSVLGEDTWMGVESGPKQADRLGLAVPVYLTQVWMSQGRTRSAWLGRERA